MGGAMLDRWLDCQPPDYAFEVVVRSRAERWEQRGIAVHPYTEGMRIDADLVLLAIKPHQVADLAASVTLAEGCGLVSVAAGITQSRLEQLFGAREIFCAMPNTPFRLGEGITLLVKPDPAYKKTESVQNLLGFGGLISAIDEGDMHFCTALTGSGPAFVFFFAEALVEAAVRHGLSREQAGEMVPAMLYGAGHLLRQSAQTPQQLREAVTSPQGVTAAGISTLEDGQLHALINDALQAASARSTAMAQEYS